MRRNVTYIFLFITIWTICLGGCERDRRGDPIELFVQNFTSDTLISALQYNFPDSVLIDFKSNFYEVNAYTTYPNSKSGFLALTGWEREIKMRNPDEILTVIVYSLDTLQKYPFEQIQNDYNILRRYDLTIEELRALNWTVTYP